MSKFLFVSYEGLIADTAWQVVKEGHEAKLQILSAGEQDIADGFVAKTKDWRKDIDWADVVVFDDVLGGMGAMADEVRARGKPVVGGSPYTDRLEEDRAFGQQELKAAGVSIIPQENFTDFDAAMASSNEVKSACGMMLTPAAFSSCWPKARSSSSRSV